MKTILHLGKTFTTKHYRDITDEEYAEIIHGWTEKPEAQDVVDQLRKIHGGGLKINHITRYYFWDLMCDVRMENDKYSVNEILQSRELCGFFTAKAEAAKKMFTDETLYFKFHRVLQLGGKGLVRIPTQFPLKTANDIISQYCFNGNYYDYSCGWGVRLLSAMRNGVNYYGTDPNPYLCQRLETLYYDYKNTNGISTTAQINCQGSEVHIPEYENKMSLCFSSPPYYNLEDYRYGDQSYKPGVTYEQWKQNYLFPTLYNCYTYLVDGGYLCINIKDKDKYPMLTDSVSYIQDALGMTCVADVVLKNGKRVHATGFLNTDEHSMVFQKIN